MNDKINKDSNQNIGKIFLAKMSDTKFELSFTQETVQAGFPSPADGVPGEQLDIASYLVSNPESTFFMRVSGDSMIDAGIFDGDLLVVDRSLTPSSGDIVIAMLDGEFTVKRLHVDSRKVELRPENRRFRTIRINDESELEIWGVVASAVKSFR
ncbi:MAG: LexA family protein [Thermoguttaceae bacterium]